MINILEIVFIVMFDITTIQTFFFFQFENRNIAIYRILI